MPDHALVYPGHGVYACRAAVEDDGEWRWWPAATNVGVRPTFVTGRGVLVEAYLLDFDGDLYGRELRLAFLERLRGERRFDSVDALVEQMHRDVEDARAHRGLSGAAAPYIRPTGVRRGLAGYAHPMTCVAARRSLRPGARA